MPPRGDWSAARMPADHAVRITCTVVVSTTAHERAVNDSGRSRSVYLPTVAWNLLAFVHAVVPDDAGHAQAIIGENLATAFGLRDPMFVCAAPGRNRRFVPEERERKDLAGLVEALEALDRYEAVDFFEQRPQLRSDIEIVLLSVRLRPDFEYDRDHFLLPGE